MALEQPHVHRLSMFKSQRVSLSVLLYPVLLRLPFPLGVADGQTLRVPVQHSEAYVLLKVVLLYSPSLTSFPLPLSLSHLTFLLSVSLAHTHAHTLMHTLTHALTHTHTHARTHTLTHQVQDSDLFERDGFDIHSNANITYTQVVLGGEVRIPGLNGPIMVKVRE